MLKPVPTQNAWGSNELFLDFPFARVRTSGLSELQQQRLAVSLARFVTHDTSFTQTFDLELSAFRTNAPSQVPTKTFDANGLYAPLQTRREQEIELVGEMFVGSINFATEPNTGYLGVFLEEQITYSLIIENYLRIYSSHLALQRGGVLLHSAGLVIDGEAYIFVGRSNAGKSTLTRKAFQSDTDIIVLSDDLNFIAQKDGQFFAYAVPFTGEFGRTIDHRGTQDLYPVRRFRFYST